jgi:xanthine dehydrogenase accessory factor
MVTAIEISSALDRSLKEGRSLAIVSLMEANGQPMTGALRLLIEEDEGEICGTLGDRWLDEVAQRHAVSLIADEKEEITVARVSELIALQKDVVEEAGLREELRDLRLLFEISRPPPEMIICGGGHVGQAVAKAARLVDFNVTVIDDRTDFASREKFPDPRISLIADDFVEALHSLKITPATHLVIVTRGHRHDEICLREVIDKPARYIGMIGSRRRTTTIRERLRREGVAVEYLRRVHAPIGLDIGAQSPEEIALAILAEIVMVRRGGTGRPKSVDGPMARTR